MLIRRDILTGPERSDRAEIPVDRRRAASSVGVTAALSVHYYSVIEPDRFSPTVEAPLTDPATALLSRSLVFTFLLTFLLTRYSL